MKDQKEMILVNSDGDTHHLTVSTKFIYNFSGVGHSDKSSYQQFDNSFIVVKKELEQIKLKGSIPFKGNDRYKQYTDFQRFCEKEPLILIYKPENIEYRLDTKLIYSNLNEIGVNVISADIQLIGLSRFYRLAKEYNSTEIRDGKKYNYDYNYNYSDDVVESVSFNVDTSLACGVKLHIYGPATNPTWSHYRNGVLETVGKINGNILNNCYVVIDTTSVPYTIKQYDQLGNLVSDMYQQSDFTTERFIKFKSGLNRVSVNHDGSNFLKMYIESKIEYRDV